jgi:leucyl aminopeptidase (aminopeptidase T)
MTSIAEQKQNGTRSSEPSGQSRYSKYARRIINDVLHLKPGENLTIEAWEHELDFAREIKLQARMIGAHVLLFVEDDKNYFRLAEGGFEKSLGNVGEHEWALVENSDAYVFFPGPADIQRQLKLEPKKRNQTTAYNDEWYDRARRAGLRGVRVRTSYATPSRADMYLLDHAKWYQNTLDSIDVDYEKIEKKAQKLAFLFKNSNSIKIRAPNGTNLRMEMSRVIPHVYSGSLPKPLKYSKYAAVGNVPGSELDVVPKPSVAEGKIVFDRPIYQSGQTIEGLSWTFRDGKLLESSAKKNYEAFQKGYKRSKGDKNRLGALVIGLTPKLVYGSTNDVNVEGAVSVGIGSLGEGDTNKTDYSFLGTLSNANVELDDVKVVVAGHLQTV